MASEGAAEVTLSSPGCGMAPEAADSDPDLKTEAGLWCRDGGSGTGELSSGACGVVEGSRLQILFLGGARAPPEGDCSAPPGVQVPPAGVDGGRVL